MKTHSLLFSLGLLCSLASCVKDDVFVEPGVPHQVQVQLRFDFRQNASRSERMEALADEGENNIGRLDCFFYPEGSDEQTPAVWHLSRQYSDSSALPVVEATVGNTQLDALFPGGSRQAKVYAIANLPEESVFGTENKSVEELKQMIITSDDFDRNVPPSSWVLDTSGEDAVTWDAAGERLSGTLYLAHAAAKVGLTVTSIQNVEEVDNEGNTVVWTAMPEGMQVYMTQGMRRGHLDGGRYPYLPTSDDDYYDTRHHEGMYFRAVGTVLPGGGESTVWEQRSPFYSYPSDWRDEPVKGPYLMLVVPWHKSTDPAHSFYNCYYQIALNTGGGQLLRNHYYKINLTVSTLGSFVEEKPEKLNPSYVILDWNTQTIDAELEHYRYLMVARDEVVLNNREWVEIPYFTSHEVKLKNVKCTRPNLSENIVTTETVNPKEYTLRLERQHILFKHPLNNNYIDDDFDFTPYTLTFTLCHQDKENYSQQVSITQYPAIYAEADMNSDYHNDHNPNNDNRHHGYTFVNGYYTDYYHYGLDRQDYFASVPGYVNRKASPNMYVFTLTSVEGTDYVIGDPREKEVSEIVDDPVTYNGYSYRSAWVEAPVLENNSPGPSSRRLKYYYETDSSEATRDMISPKFRIASAYAVLSTQEYPARRLDAMKKRCASYQEDGYPAGRWRLPTQAEFQFIMSQVDKGRMPQLYLKGQPYWCAHGIGTPTGNGHIKMEYVNSSYYGYSTRCVYDEWYWNDRLQGAAKKKFTWGDRKR